MSDLLGHALAWILGAIGCGAAGMALANRRVDPGRARRRWIKFTVYLLVILVEVVLAATGWLVLLALPVVVAGAREIRGALAAAPPPGLPPALVRRVAAIAVALATGLVAFALGLPPACQLVVVLQVLAFDGFSQVVGQLVGRHRLVPRLSPGKTWEGLAGGLAACLLLAWFLRDPAGLAPGPALAAGSLTAGLALAGDLTASALKRRCALKDFGDLLPGHGGVLDRFDSLLMVAAGWALVAALAGGAMLPCGEG